MYHFLIGSLSKQTRRPRGGGQQENFYSEGLKAKWIQSAADIIHSLIWKEIWMWPPPLGRRVSLLKLPNISSSSRTVTV